MLDIAYLHQKPTLHQSPVHHAGRRGKKVRWKAATVNETGSGKSDWDERRAREAKWTRSAYPIQACGR
jgi:hypothetical protein